MSCSRMFNSPAMWTQKTVPFLSGAFRVRINNPLVYNLLKQPTHVAHLTEILLPGSFHPPEDVHWWFARCLCKLRVYGGISTRILSKKQPTVGLWCHVWDKLLFFQIFRVQAPYSWPKALVIKYAFSTYGQPWVQFSLVVSFYLFCKTMRNSYFIRNLLNFHETLEHPSPPSLVFS